MPRAIWKGAVSFGLVSIPVKLYSATEDNDVRFHQVHAEDGGRVKYQRVCQECGEVVAYKDLAKGFEADDDRVAVLTDEDFEDLPLKSMKSVDVVRFVDEHDVDPTYFVKTYYLETDQMGQKPYVLLREALQRRGKAAVVKVALRSRESLALIRADDEVLRLHTMLWPDEVRDESFAAPPENVTVTDDEIKLADLLINQLEGEFDPSLYTDEYREALLKVVQAKLEGVPVPEFEEEADTGGDVIDLMAALKASVAAIEERRKQAS